ncbi:MAG: hypothetical protein HYU64_20305 [Armatimonadetes bacterium]|nr:hypothetical protein [Armatimonadota bacterium]
MKKTMIIVALFWLCLAFQPLGAEKTESGDRQLSFSIPQHGELILSVPGSWKQSAGRPMGIFPTIVFSPPKGDAFEVSITPLWSPKNDPTFNRPEKVKNMIESDLRSMLSQAVEKDAKVQEFAGISGKGCYFLLTDKAPKPGEHPYAMRAGIGVGDLLLSVTILSRSKNSEGITATIKALQEAWQRYK